MNWPAACVLAQHLTRLTFLVVQHLPSVTHLFSQHSFAAAAQAVPFLYELRVLLDWTAAATSLSWYQWLKLEDIRASLFLDEVRAAGRASRALGERVPRWQKFLQVGG
jgi:hypothetical protein